MPQKTSTQDSIDYLLKWFENRKSKGFRAVVMPDFFFDRFVQYPKDFNSFSRNALEIVRRKGGSMDYVKQVNFRGGNAANTAAAFAALGATVYPIIETDPLGLTLLKHFLQPLNVNLNHVKTKGKASITTALEFLQNGRVNIMLRDLGSLVDFGPKNLTLADYDLLASADVVCVFNWAGTLKHGTELAQTVFRYVKTKGKGVTYYDTADPLPNEEEIPTLVEHVLMKDFVDILSINENEAVQYATCINPKHVTLLRKKYRKLEKLALECAVLLAEYLSARIDLHTTAYSATFCKNKKPQVVSSFKVKTLRATGAGDSWNAGNIYADQQGLSDKIRLTFANAVAAYYVSNPNGAHPTISQLKSFLKKAVTEPRPQKHLTDQE
jgi:sugar/nucleoside kinase (ribokinase family)